MNKCLISLKELDKSEIKQILDIASQMRRIVLSTHKKSPQLLGKSVAVCSADSISSVAVNLASNFLSATTVKICPEDFLELAKALGAFGVDFVFAQHPNENLLRDIDKNGRYAVINLETSSSNPLKVLSYLLTLQDKLDGLSNLTVLAVGNKNVSAMGELSYALQLFGSELVWFLPKEDFVTVRRGIIFDNVEIAFDGVDAVIDLKLAEFSDSRLFYGDYGGIPKRLLDKARIDVALLDCRNIVTPNGITEYPYSAQETQYTALISVIMAVMYLLNN
ncbi:MAG: hypothetical protein RR291_02950 [Clostridia bacterium]